MRMINDNKSFTLNKNNYSNNDKLPIKLDIDMMNAIIGYIYTSSSQITRKCLMNLKQLFNIMDSAIYDSNIKMKSRFYFITKSLECILDRGVTNKGLVLNYVINDNSDEELINIRNSLTEYKELSYTDISYITEAVEQRLKYSVLFKIKEPLYETIEKLDRGDYDNLEDVWNIVNELCKEVVVKSRQIRVMENIDTFSLDEATYEQNITKIIKRMTDETHILRTGIKYHNDILAGGYYGKRLYMYMALPGNFKSGILLKAARDIKKYNKGIKTRRGGQPTVLLITCENDVDETVGRLFTMTSSNDSIDKYSPAEAMRLLKTVGQLVVEDEHDINIVIKYFPNQAISTGDLYTIIDDLADEGKEVIALIVDYLKRIRPELWAKEEKEQLKNSSNELKTLAIDYNIPVITAMQLNREAARAIDQAAQNGKTDLIRMAGRANVGSSWEIMENSDWACIINLEEKKDNGQMYLSFNRVKMRYKQTDRISFSHPFNIDNRMMLLDDVMIDNTLSVDYIGSDFGNNVDFSDLIPNKKKNKKNGMYNIDDTDNGIFDFGKSVNTVS